MADEDLLSRFSDLEPLAQDDGPNPVVQIAYPKGFQDVMDLFRRVVVNAEYTERTFELTAAVCFFSHEPPALSVVALCRSVALGRSARRLSLSLCALGTSAVNKLREHTCPPRLLAARHLTAHLLTARLTCLTPPQGDSLQRGQLHRVAVPSACLGDALPWVGRIGC